jgi:threonine/homoserine/homoserine lactone efflux protein
MSSDQLIAFFVFAVVAAVTPGPSNPLVMVASERAGFAGGRPCLAGVVAGMALMMGGANLGLGGLIQASPNAGVTLKRGRLRLFCFGWPGKSPAHLRCLPTQWVILWASGER